MTACPSSTACRGSGSFSVMGFGGNGITFSVIGAQVIAAAIAGRPDPDADLFRYR